MTCAFQGCRLPCHFDATTGIRHDYCGRRHAQAALAARGEMLAAPHGVCHICKLDGCEEPVYFEASTGRVHDFCCRGHAMEAIERREHPASNKRIRSCSVTERCALPGCTSPRFVDEATGRVHDFCGRSHAILAYERGLLPPSFEPRASVAPSGSIEKIWRGRSGDPEYTISVLNSSHPKIQGVIDQFQNSWTHDTAVPRVQRVLQIRNSREVYSRYEYEYKRSVAQRRGERNTNEVRRFHGTRLGNSCSFGIDPVQPPCSNSDCSVCSIMATAFDSTHAGSNAGQVMTLRYGVGNYFSRSSSKANDYASGSERTRNGGVYRVMFLTKCVLGITYETKRASISQTDVNDIASRYDSLTGLTTDNGGALNHEENVLYHNSAAIPSYLIVYRL